MALPVIALVGRPNVGKSTLFNRLTSQRNAIVQDLPGVTRDRHYGEAEVLSRRFIVIDTGGFEPESTEGMLPAMRRQAEIAIEEADVVIALYDGPAGVTPGDQELAQMLVRRERPVFHAVNKIDGPKHDALVAEFWEMGVTELYPVSAQHGGGILDMMEEVFEVLPEATDEEEENTGMVRIAVIGKPNAGKSTLVNRMLGEERLLVSDVPGTTRDAIDTVLECDPDPDVIAAAAADLEELEAQVAGAIPDMDEEAALSEDDDATGDEWAFDEEEGFFDDTADDDFDMEDREWEAPENTEDDARALEEAREALERARLPRKYLVIDTAGIRRRKWIKTKLERVSIIQSFKSIDRAEVCLLLIDATAGITEQDVKLAGMIHDKGRSCVILVNKWDAVKAKDSHTAGAFVKDIRDALKFLRHAPVVFISGLTGQRVHRILGIVEQVRRAARLRVSTGAFNRFVAAVVRRHQPPMHKNRRLRIYYGSQVATAPPTFLLHVNDGKLLHFSYRRFLANQIRRAWGFDGTPIRLILRRRAQRKGR